MKFLYIIFILLFPQICTSAEIKIETKVDRSVIHIGDYITYSIIIHHAPNIKVLPPSPGANLGNFDIKDYNTIEKEDKKIFEYKITTYFLGEFEIPSIEIAYIDKNNNRGVLKTEPLIIKVVPVERKPNDKDDIREIKKQIYLRDLTILYIILIILFLVGLFLLFKKYLFLKKEKITEIKEEKKLPEDIEALNKIEQLLYKNYLKDGKIKEFYFELSEIFREYLSRRYNIITLERTSSEILFDLNKIIYDRDIFKNITEFFNDTDLVKFAKYIPSKNEIEDIIKLTKEIIERTKRPQINNEIPQS
jgi:hypothetical protein